MGTSLYENIEKYICKITHKAGSLSIAAQTEFLFYVPCYPSLAPSLYAVVNG